MRLQISCLVLALGTGVLPAQAHGQDGEAQESSEPANPPVIVVTGAGLAQPLSTPAYDSQLIEREALVSTASGRVDDALATVAGVQQFRRSDSRSANPSAQGITVRALGGNATSRALVLLDGVPMADPFFGFVPFTAIAPERLAAIRVTRGGGSGPFGAGALAGTIELTSADASALGNLGGHAYLNDRGGSESAAHLAGELGSGFGVLSARWDRDRGFFTTPPEDRVDATARARFENFSLQARGVAPLTDTIEIQARALVYDDRRTLRFQGANSSSSGQDASIRLVGRGAWQFDALAYLQARNFTNRVISSTRFVPVLDQRNTPSTGLGGKLEVRPPVGQDHLLRMGADYRRSDGDLFETAINAFRGTVSERRNAGGVNTDLGLFVENDWSLGPLVLTAGARLDRYAIRDGYYEARDADGVVLREERYADRSGWAQSFRAGALFEVDEALTLRTAAYTGLRLPTLNELYRPFVIFPVTTRANAALENEELIGVEAGLDLEPAAGFQLSLGAFYNRIDGAITNVTLDERTRERQNIDAIAARGVEARLRAEHGSWRVDSSLAYTDAKVAQPGAPFDGMRPAQSPALLASGSVTYRIGEGSSVSAMVRHLGKQFEDDRETDVLPAVTTLSAYAQFGLTDSLALVLRGENLTDEDIVTRNQAGSIDYGTPRTLWAGLKLGL